MRFLVEQHNQWTQRISEPHVYHVCWFFVRYWPATWVRARSDWRDTNRSYWTNQNCDDDLDDMRESECISIKIQLFYWHSCPCSCPSMCVTYTQTTEERNREFLTSMLIASNILFEFAFDRTIRRSAYCNNRYRHNWTCCTHLHTHTRTHTHWQHMRRVRRSIIMIREKFSNIFQYKYFIFSSISFSLARTVVALLCLCKWHTSWTTSSKLLDLSLLLRWNFGRAAECPGSAAAKRWTWVGYIR